MSQTSDTFHMFAPGPETGSALRTALGRFTTGVTVVTCNSELGPLGITANSFAGVSLDPPLVLWSPARFSRRFDAFADAPHFAIHVLGAEQSHISDGFAREGQAFDGLDWRLGAHDVPLIENCLSRFECRRVARHDGGDHAIVVGHVTHVATRPGPPLVFHGGSYGDFV